MPRKYNLDIVTTIFMGFGYILLAEKYNNSKERMPFYCPDCDSEQTLRLNDLTQGHLCPNCGNLRKTQNMREQALAQRSSTERVRKELESRNLTLVGEYKTAQHKIKFKCLKHPKELQEARLSDLREYRCCALCSRESRKLPYDEVLRRFNDRGYYLMSPRYKNSSTKLLFVCEKHQDYLQKIDISGITQGHGCYYCGIEKYSGENHHRYNPNLTQYEREYVRKYDLEIPKWRIAVYRRDHFTCQMCGRKDVQLNAHHKDGFNWCKERRYDVTNGITLCEGCHVDFHRKYGFGDNTEQQFEEYVESQRGVR